MTEQQQHLAEIADDIASADAYAAHAAARPARCRFYDAPYCMAHDYDHVLERRESVELDDDFNARWAGYKAEFAEREREQEEAVYAWKAERDERLGWTR